MAQDNSSLPPIRKSRPHSSVEEKGAWNRLLAIQRKMNADQASFKSSPKVTTSTSSNRVHSATNRTSQNVKVSRANVCPRFARSMRSETILEVVKSPEQQQHQSHLSRLRNQESNNQTKILEEEILKSLSEPLCLGDDPFVLEGISVLEHLHQFQREKCSEKILDNQQIINLNVCKLKLQALLLAKVRSITERDCLLLTQDGFNYVRQLESLYTEDKYKLTTAESYEKLSEKERKVAIDDFVNITEKRRQLPEQSEEKINNWINNLNNSNRLLNVNHRLPKERLCVLFIRKTVDNLERIRLSIIHWLRLIVRAAIKIMTIYWDYLPFECLCNVFHCCLSYNKIFAGDKFNPISLIADVHARCASSKITFLVHNEVKKIISAKRRASPTGQGISDKSSDPITVETDQEIRRLGIEETSDYCTASASSDDSARRGPIPQQQNQIDLSNYLQIVSSSGQRVVMKLSFAAQNVLISSASRIESDKSKQSIGNFGALSISRRSTWSKLNEQESEVQKYLFHSFDKAYWPRFWYTFGRELSFNILLINIKNVHSSPLSMCPEFFRNLVRDSLLLTVQENDLTSDASKSLEFVGNEVSFHISMQNWIRLYWNFHEIHQNTDSFTTKKDLNLILFTSTMRSMINSIGKEDSTEIDCHFHKLVSMEMVESIVLSLEYHVRILIVRENPEFFLKLFKQVNIVEQDVRSLRLIRKKIKNLETILNQLDSIRNELMAQTCIAIRQGVYQFIAKRILERRKNHLDEIEEDIIMKMNDTLLNKSIDFLSFHDETHAFKLQMSILDSVCQVLVDILNGQTKIKLNQKLKYTIQKDCIKLIKHYETKFRDHQDQLPNGFVCLRSQCFGSSGGEDTYDLCLIMRGNRVGPTEFGNWPNRSPEPSFASCGCFAW
ncbi:uncharacterized protein LOC141857425 isoform X2 [Brevipalpus obovatus]|uniref:uncharacterized protein LOC141857425 isoform X2 n=2 Tax=Brevipalpus obovatus TaxID=246614 RepID=UPI003D9F0C5E